MPSSELICMNIQSWNPGWSEFARKHSAWLEERKAESAVVYRLPRPAIDHLERFLCLRHADVEAERAFDQLCGTQGVGVRDDRLIEYRWLSPRLDTPPREMMTDCGWTEAQIQTVLDQSSFLDSIACRLAASAGRLICNPKFLEERNRLRDVWSRLRFDQRPLLPLDRSPRFRSVPKDIDRVAVSRPLKKFFRDFDAFCDHWRLLGMATWDLPNPDGPKWPEPLSFAAPNDSDSHRMDTPWHFAVQAKDDLGRIAEERHRARAEEMGVVDHRKYEVYAHLLKIDHWERVIRGRYVDHRPPGFITELEWILADLLPLKFERVGKIRKLRSSLIKGRRRSIEDWR